MTSTYKDLIVWQKSKDLVLQIYKITAQLPDHEKYVLISQMRRAAVSIPSNIAEGKTRGGNYWKQFLLVAYGSGAELETQISIAKDLYVKIDFSEAEELLLEVMKMLNKLINNETV